MHVIREIFRQLRISLIALLCFSLLLGVGYPFLITGFAQLFFPHQANGSLVSYQNLKIGSELIGQNFTNPKYFWGRPSAARTFPYNPLGARGSDFGPTSERLINAVKSRVGILQQADPGNDLAIPIDLVTASGSGLDPDISPLAAYYQVHRVAKARELTEQLVQKIVDANIIDRQWGFLGEPRINVLRLNLALDGYQSKKKP